MAVESVLESQKPTGSPDDWVQWFAYRLRQEPWALGGAVVIAVFVLGTLSLVVFALLFGCCCSQGKQTQKKMKSSQDGVI
ncbi:hypothetical protein Q5P01_023871 [Channa striata]|uniref:Uncharacterized protein n=1 Tax=Channa striata TaxID=64152 RepID=A0AA88J2Z6_CHASR|nr:hypothetical protein Q5P01_023871 [Channa striata]